MVGTYSEKRDKLRWQKSKRMKVGKKKRGRAKRRWEDCIKGDMEKMGVYEDDANDRKRWREMICTGNPIRMWEKPEEEEEEEED